MIARFLAQKMSWLRRRWGALSMSGRACMSVLTLTLVGYIAHTLYYSAFFVEDAGISFSYAKNLAHGDGLVPYVGGERVEGYSNALWTFLIAGFYLVGVPVWTTKACE